MKWCFAKPWVEALCGIVYISYELAVSQYSQGNVVHQVTSLLGGGTVSPPEDQKLLNKYTTNTEKLLRN